jgi:dTDP-4-amino-4,6-dideoxygalactose transaminase
MTKFRTEFLPFALPDIDGDELEQVKQVLQSGWLTTGAKTVEFEKAFASYLGAKHAIALNSCTAAMHLALEAVKLQPGDFVLTSPYTFAATAEVIRYFNAVPVFVDVERDTLNIDPEKLTETIQDLQQAIGGSTPRTSAVKRALAQSDPDTLRSAVVRAVMPVHIAGHPCQVDRIYEIAAQYDMAIIEDAAHSLPARYKGHLIGAPVNDKFSSKIPANKKPPSFITCFSFYATKTLTTGEGGMLVTEDDDLAERCRIMSLHGISKDAWKRYTSEGSWYYEIIAPGFKYNMTDVASALGVAQFRKLERMMKRRKDIAQKYNEAFSSLAEFEIPTVRKDVDHSWHLYMLRLNPDRMRLPSNSKTGIRGEFIQDLKRRNIGTSVHFIPLHLHPYYRDLYGYRPEDFPVALGQFERAVSLPIYSRMSDVDVEDVITAVKESLKRSGD